MTGEGVDESESANGRDADDHVSAHDVNDVIDGVHANAAGVEDQVKDQVGPNPSLFPSLFLFPVPVPVRVHVLFQLAVLDITPSPPQSDDVSFSLFLPYLFHPSRPYLDPCRVPYPYPCRVPDAHEPNHQSTRPPVPDLRPAGRQPVSVGGHVAVLASGSPDIHDSAVVVVVNSPAAAHT